MWCRHKPFCMIWCASHTALHCNTLHYTATHCHTLPHTATHCHALQHTATRPVASFDALFLIHTHTFPDAPEGIESVNTPTRTRTNSLASFPLTHTHSLSLTHTHTHSHYHKQMYQKQYHSPILTIPKWASRTVRVSSKFRDVQIPHVEFVTFGWRHSLIVDDSQVHVEQGSCLIEYVRNLQIPHIEFVTFRCPVLAKVPLLVFVTFRWLI